VAKAFRKTETNNLCPVKEKKSKEEESAEITRHIVYSTKQSEPIVVAYLSSSESESEQD